MFYNKKNILLLFSLFFIVISCNKNEAVFKAIALYERKEKVSIIKELVKQDLDAKDSIG